MLYFIFRPKPFPGCRHFATQLYPSQHHLLAIHTIWI